MDYSHDRYSRIIDTLQDLNGRNSLLNDIKNMRFQIDSLQINNHHTLSDLRVSSKPVPLNYRLKKSTIQNSSPTCSKTLFQQKIPEVNESPSLNRQSYHERVVTQFNQNSEDYKLPLLNLSVSPSRTNHSKSRKQQYFKTREKSAISINLLEKQKFTTRSKSPFTGRPKPQASIVDLPLNNFAFIPFNKIYNSSIAQLLPGERLGIQKQSKIKDNKYKKQKIADPLKFKFDKIHLDLKTLFKSLLEKPTKTTLFIGPKSTQKKKIFIEWVSAQLKGMAELASLRAVRSQICKLLVTYSQQYSGSKQSDQINLMKQQIRFTNQQFQSGRVKVEQAIEQIKCLASQKRIRGAFRTREVSIRFQDYQGEVHQHIITSNNLSKFVQTNNGTVVWCLNPLFKNYKQLKMTLETSKKYAKKS